MLSNWTYLVINIATIFFPLLCWNLKKLPSKQVFKYYWKAVLTSGLIFISWDVFVTWRGHWYFNPDYTLGIKIINLPFEEILFFICIPFSSLYLFEVLNYLIKDKLIKNKYINFSIFGFILIILNIIYLYKYEYTFIIVNIVGILFIFSFKYWKLFNSVNFWIYQLFMFIPFGIVNGILTSLPVVSYNSQHITNVRIGTIPLEDFTYSFALLTSYLTIYHWEKSKRDPNLLNERI